MTATATLFERWKAVRGIQSDRQAMRELGLSPGAAVHWKDGREAGADIIERMAKDIGEDPVKWAALAMAGQTKGEASRAWSRFARKLGAAAAVGAVALFAHFPTAQATSLNARPVYTLCEVVRRATALIGAALRSARGRSPAPVLA